MKYDLCLFDLDGTLVNTLDDLTDAVNAALMHYGYPSTGRAEVSAAVGHSVAYMCRELLPSEDADRQRDVAREFYACYGAHLCDKSRPYEGVLRALQTLRAAGLRLAVVSNKPHAHTVKLLAALFPSDMFSIVLGRMEKFKLKPDPDSLLFVLDYLHVPPERAVYVGDSDVDVDFARHAGVDCVSVSWGLRGRRVLETAGAACIIDDAGELAEKVLLS